MSQLKPDYEKEYPNVLFCEPFGYFEMIWCLQHAKYVITDSGGLQKEAYFFKKLCITLRDETEWTELVDYGYNVLSRIEKNEILRNYRLLDTIKKDFNEELYGNGKTGELILRELQNY